ncbi:MAG: SufD family Fe-S cluster assembly protein [Paludibacteraceae bacterium]|nr:SufD family Fe-S cluster assembly protein [Paludibacteraceae bacterium]
MTEVHLHNNESFEQVFLNEPVDLQITQEAGSRVKVHVIDFEISKSRDREITNRIVVEQAGEGCETEIYALAYLRGEEKVTTETHVNHAVGGGKSNQLIKFVLDDDARGRFIGDLKIAPDAQQVEANQTNRNLLLSETAEMRTQPQLEIYADDVKASHGASTGQLDESALFYMQQRGIGKQKARQLLIGAFMKEVIETISNQYSAIRDEITQYIESES